MGDTSWIGITWYEIPNEHREDVFNFMDEHFWGFDEEEIILGEQYTADEHSLGFCSDEVVPFIGERPNLVVEAHQAPRYEFNGDVVMHTPDLGTFSADEDGQGEVIVSDDLIQTIFMKLPSGASAAEYKAALDDAAGVPWRDHFAALYKQHEGTPEGDRRVTRPTPDEAEEMRLSNSNFYVTFDTANAAFLEGRQDEVARILRKLAERVENGIAFDDRGEVLDANGTSVGNWRWTS